jgi:hypothetical protein
VTAIPIPDELLDELAARVAERFEARTPSPWMDRKAAASYLGLPVSRLEKDRAIPCHRDGRRVLYHRGELDEHFLES